MTLYDLRVISRQGNSIIKTFVYDSKTSMADNVHKALDIAGFIPGIGSFSEGANSLLYAFQGEKGEAALAALSVIPGIKAVKVLKDGIQYLKIYVCDVELEAGTHIRVGEVNPLDGWGTGGGIQYDLIGQRIGKFINERPLE
ncbi:hypothetical protein [Pectinatus frisingensis]|uniref:hypothetical protein n=2 Tax=Pectinatus frisingensis TaxID=865 RepID=UPI003D8078AA